MFLKTDDLHFQIFDVLKFKQEKRYVCHNKKRAYYALSFRKHADSQLEYADKTVITTDGCIALVPQNLEYTRICKNEEMTVIHFHSDDCFGDGILTYYPQSPEIHEKMFDEIYRIFSLKDCGYRLKCNEYMYRILYNIYKDERNNSENDDISQNAARIIEKRLYDPDFSIAEVSDVLGISSVYLRNKFEQSYGISPKEYLINERMDMAANLLKTNYFNIKGVSIRSGYSNEKYFATAFKKKFGVSPNEYKHK